MRIRAITPIHVSDEELRRRQQRYDRLAPEGWTIELENLPADAPSQLGTMADVRESERIMHERGRGTGAAGFDALLPDCVLDPAVPELDADADARVLGISRLAAAHLAASGTAFGVLVRNETIGREYAAVIERYGHGDLFRGVYVLGLSVEDIADDELWNAAVVRAAERAHDDGVTVLINGCSAVEVTVGESQVRVIDPTALALRVAAGTA